MNKKNDVTNKIDGIRKSKVRAFQRRTKVTELAMQSLIKNGAFFQTPQDGFYFHGPSKQLFPLEQHSRGLAAFIEKQFGLNEAERGEYQHLLAALANHAYRDGQKTCIYRLAHYDSISKTLYVSRFDGNIYRLDGKCIELVPNGTDKVFFWDDPQWEKYEVTEAPKDVGAFERTILRPVNFATDQVLRPDEQRWLFRVWLLAQFFDTLHPTKPIALVTGEKGAGKTSAMRKWEKVLFGPEGEVSALERGKADGFIATVSSNPVAIFDNVDEKIAWLPDHLAQVATGITIRRRRLYTTNQEVSYLPNCWIGLTSRTPDFLNGREDVLDRTLVFRTARLKENTPEHHLLEEVQTNRNQIWSELLKCLNRIVAYYRSGPKSAGKMNYRMADFAEFAVALGRLEHREEIAHRVLGKLECAQTEMLFEQDPILDCLCEWLKTGKNRGREVTAAELSGDLGRIADMCSLPWPYSGARSLGQRLPHILRNLKERFELEQRKDSAGQWHYKFWPKSGTLNHPERPSPLLPDVQSTVEQGDPNLSLNH